MRGKGPPQLLRCRVKGITPACAGKRPGWECSTTKDGDHPRVCGEKLFRCVFLSFLQGSPPRVRGKAGDHFPDGTKMGITPACAGKSFPKSLLMKLMWDHPRVCGEKIVLVIVFCSLMGSPPRVRGKGPSSGSTMQIPRITPACAGKRLKRSHSIGHFSCILYLFHSVLHRASVSGGSRAGPCAPPCLPAQNAVPV